MAEKKITKKQNFTTIMDILNELGKTELANVMAHEIELLNKKNSTPKKPTEKQEQGEAIKKQILEVLADGKPKTATEIQKAVGIESNQRATALIRQLKDENLVIRTVEKGKALFSIPVAD